MIGSKFTDKISAQKYDLIIIGSGISGLTLASLQAKQGKKVLVLEKHYIAGGFTHTYRRKGYEWDTGLHYIGEVHQSEHPLRKVFDYISDKKINWAPMPEAYDIFSFPDRSYSAVAGKEKFRQNLLDSFPDESKAIDEYLHLIKIATKQIENRISIKLLPKKVEEIFIDKEAFSPTTWDVLSKLTKNQKLIAVLCGLWGDYGLPPKQSSFVVHAVIASHYLNGAAFPVGGSSAIAESIVDVIEKNGGEVVISCGVKKILVKHGTAIGVELENGHTILAEKIVSSAGLHKTYLDLFSPADLPNGVLNRANELKASSGYISVTLGFKEHSSVLNHSGANLWLYPGYDHDENVRKYLSSPLENLPPMNFISFPSLKDPTWDERVGPNTVVDMLGLLPFEWVKKWQDSNRKNRPDEYKDLKLKLASPYLSTFDQLFPQLRGKVDVFEVSTPLTVNHYVNYKAGEIYGLNLTPERFLNTELRPSTPIKNFYMTGQDILTNGVCGAMMSGVITSLAISPLKTFGQLLPEKIF